LRYAYRGAYIAFVGLSPDISRDATRRGGVDARVADTTRHEAVAGDAVEIEAVQKREIRSLTRRARSSLPRAADGSERGERGKRESERGGREVGAGTRCARSNHACGY
jgi:hypothetical protein